MLRIVMSTSGESAEKYYHAALKTADYYGSQFGLWGGKGADRLGLTGRVGRKDFVALAKNQVPGSDGEQLTVRTKSEREQVNGNGEVEKVPNRRAGYDFTFSVPKSVSLYLAETGDKEVEEMIQHAFKETMAEIEERMETRVRG